MIWIPLPLQNDWRRKNQIGLALTSNMEMSRVRLKKKIKWKTTNSIGENSHDKSSQASTVMQSQSEWMCMTIFPYLALRRHFKLILSCTYISRLMRLNRKENKFHFYQRLFRRHLENFLFTFPGICFIFLFLSLLCLRSFIPKYIYLYTHTGRFLWIAR